MPSLAKQGVALCWRGETYVRLHVRNKRCGAAVGADVFALVKGRQQRALSERRGGEGGRGPG